MTAATLPISAGGFFATSTNQGVSRDADFIRENLMEVLRSLYDSCYIRDVHGAAHNALNELATEASVDNWDGYGARAVSEQTFRKALCFLRSLPSTVPSPAVSPEPDGEVAFEWRPGPGRAFSVSVGEGDILTFASLHGRRKVHGTELLVDDLPDTILRELGRTLVE